MATDRYAVLGNPIAHSKSPRIHTLFAQQTGQDLEYEAILVPGDRFNQSLTQFQRDGGKGVNVTVPFKQEAWALVDQRSARAELARAVNTITLRDDGQRLGDNTDGVGLVRDLTVNHGIALADCRVLLVGAGGAVRGVLGALLEQRPRRIVIANRTEQKALELAERFAAYGPVIGGGFDALAGQSFDLIVNATSASLEGEVPPLPEETVTAKTSCYDMMYADEPTAFVRWARERGAGVAVDGLGMLVEQAAESFYLWRGVRPETGPVIAALRA